MGTFSALAPMKTKQRAQQGLGPIQRTHIFLEHSHRLNAILNHKGTSGPLGKTSILIISYRNRLLHKIKHNTNFLSSAKQWMENLYFTEGHLPSRGTPAPLSVHLYSSTSLLDFQHLYVFFTKKIFEIRKIHFPHPSRRFSGRNTSFLQFENFGTADTLIYHHFKASQGKKIPTGNLSSLPGILPLILADHSRAPRPNSEPELPALWRIGQSMQCRPSPAPNSKYNRRCDPLSTGPADA